MILSFIFSFTSHYAQEGPSELKLSLKEAREYASRHNKSIISARLETQASEKARWEVVSGALPQVSYSAGFTDNIKQMVFLIPDFFSGNLDNKIPITMGTQYNSSLSLQANMLLFNAPLYIGIETANLANRLAETNVKKTELDINESVANAYYLILVSEESLRILDDNLANLHEVLESTKAMYSAGMAEPTDVDQMASNVSMVENSRSSLERTIELNYNLLRFQLGVGSATKLILSETLEDVAGSINVVTLLAQEFKYTDYPDYKLIKGQERLSALNLRSQKAQVLPTLAGVFSTTKTGMGDKIADIEWYNSSLVGLQLSIPIIAGGQRYFSIKKAQINFEKAKTAREILVDQLMLQEKQLRYNLVNANLQYRSQKENVDVARRIYVSVENKFKNGMASSLELTQANSAYLQAENNYISALMNLLQTKLALDKLMYNN